MSKERDLLFCQIAVQAGLVSEKDAKRCLGLSQKLEAEGRRPPSVGVIFGKAKVLSQENVQRVQQAVDKRLGSQPAAARPRRGARRGREAAPGEGPRSRTARGVTRSRVARNTLWMYIGSGVVFVALTIAMGFMLLRAGYQSPPSTAATPSAESDAAGQTLDDLLGEVEAPRPVPSTDSETYRAFEEAHKTAIRDAWAFQRDLLYEDAAAALANFAAAQEANYELWPGLREELEAEITKLAENLEGRFAEEMGRAQEKAAAGELNEAIEILENFQDRVGEEMRARVAQSIEELRGEP